MSSIVKFGKHLREIRLHFCQKSASSKGIREFVETHYVKLKQENPKFPVLIRECEGIKPKVWARYQFGKEKCANLEGLSADEVLLKINVLSRDI